MWTFFYNLPNFLQYLSVLYEMPVMWRPLAWKLDPQFLDCFMSLYGPKNRFNKFKKILNVEIFSIASPTSCNIEEFCLKCW